MWEVVWEVVWVVVMEARGRRGFGWFGGVRGVVVCVDDGGSVRCGGVNDVMEMVVMCEMKVWDEWGDGLREARASTDERET